MARPPGSALPGMDELVNEIDDIMQESPERKLRAASVQTTRHFLPSPPMDRRHSYASLASTSGTRRRPLPPTPRGPRVPTRLPSAPSPAPSIPAPNAPPSYASVHTPSADAKPRRHSGKPLAWPPEKHESLEHDMLPVYTPRPQSVSVEKKAPVELPPEEVHDITA